ncbi:MAG TPA: alpha/beta hydrolase [Candidatus Bathyarchaeia archaeon]|nr:alpha/beta hydrolase [Candidatus Bathyarchaeia archaeon]
MFCKVKDVDIYYEVIGQGKPVLMLHGFPLDHRMMKGALEPIFSKRKGWMRIYVDYPGMGKSSSADWIKGSDVFVEILLNFIDQIIGTKRFLIIGESFGGAMARAILYHRKSQIDGLFLFAPTIRTDGKHKNLPIRNIIEIDEEFMKTLPIVEKEFLESFAVKQNEYTWKRVKDETYSGYLSRNQSFIVYFEKGRALTYDIDDLQEPFDKPTLIITGRQDHWIGYRDAWDVQEKNYPCCTFAVLDVAGHGLQYEQVDIFNVMTHEWLDRVESDLLRK